MRIANGRAAALALVLGLALVACGGEGDGGASYTDAGAGDSGAADEPAGTAGEDDTGATTPDASGDDAPKDKWAAYTKVLPFVVGSEAGFEAAAAADKAAMLFLTATW